MIFLCVYLYLYRKWELELLCHVVQKRCLWVVVKCKNKLQYTYYAL